MATIARTMYYLQNGLTMAGNKPPKRTLGNSYQKYLGMIQNLPSVSLTKGRQGFGSGQIGHKGGISKNSQRSVVL